ncbi:MAG: CBS domain-containing protein [Bacillota bacterium]|jgi:CBS-domain-containing membrane protein
MKISFFLIPKMETAYMLEENTVRQALEKMEFHQYNSLSVLDDKGKYKYSLSATDFFHYMKQHPGTSYYNTKEICLSEITPLINVSPISINDDIENLMKTLVKQEYTPVIDGNGIYIGEVSATEIMEFIVKNQLIKNEY